MSDDHVPIRGVGKISEQIRMALARRDPVSHQRNLRKSSSFRKHLRIVMSTLGKSKSQKKATAARANGAKHRGKKCHPSTTP